MPKATLPNGLLAPINDCYLKIPSYGKMTFQNLPEISDSKNAVYNAEGILGRASPFHTYSHSDTRTISLTLHFFVLEQNDIDYNLGALRAIQSCTYPRIGTGIEPFRPPPVCTFKCGDLLAKDQELCLTLQQYNVQFPSDVVWDKTTLLPYKFDISTTWWVVYTAGDLPDQTRIIVSGR